jgi:hypothetical protein
MSMTPPSTPPAPATPATPATPPPAEYKAPGSQEEFDRIIEGRLQRERTKYADYDDLKKKADDHDTYVESQKTQTQKDIDAARGEASTEVTQKFVTKLVNGEVKAIAATLGFNDPADALQVIDLSKLPMKDDEPDTDAIKALVEKLATDKPYLVAGDGSRKPRTRPKTPTGDPAPNDDAQKGGKGKAAAALRQLAASRKGS